MNCTICQKEIVKPKIKYCSNTCKQAAHYKRNKTDNPNTTYSQFKRADIRKKEFILLKGGACSVCGYNRNYSALSFHHTGIKNFPLDSRNIGNRNKQTLLNELESCILLCLNCHMEHHNPELVLN